MPDGHVVGPDGVEHDRAGDGQDHAHDQVRAADRVDVERLQVPVDLQVPALGEQRAQGAAQEVGGRLRLRRAA